ncbi:DNA/RNA endonuclease G [Candidatus Rhodobacter oscarellae]|uniref:Endonuclease n=1 Tax=Candidatus Rhodobacter oscarellae TaxID=1675527 RepID=A0A0J9E910_9RHOB|nr:DNA/RNA non-specific endonuclease [Candidatus Rhodobacter lobularis]KMW58149.1 DNA/RNA endonuclease G [Candidatus Rhodobacter lobularis]
MIEIPSLRPETRYGTPPADQLLFNREYVIGYSYLFRQPRWSLQLINPANQVANVDREDTFRADLRIPDQFQSELDDYKGSGFDRGHLVPSADHRSTELKNSETFLLSNMAPQAPKFNRQIWRILEGHVRDLSEKYVEVYAMSGPYFKVGEQIKVIGKTGEGQVVVPHGFFKSILAESVKGKMDLWSFMLPNEGSDKPLKDFLVSTREVEMWTGLPLWERLRDPSFERKKTSQKRTTWF